MSLFNRATGIAILLTIFVASEARAAEPRTPWVTSHITGSPDAPPPFELQRLYPKLKFKEPVEIAFAPGSNRIFVAEKAGRILSFVNNDQAAKPDVFVNLQQII